MASACNLDLPHAAWSLLASHRLALLRDTQPPKPAPVRSCRLYSYTAASPAPICLCDLGPLHPLAAHAHAPSSESREKRSAARLCRARHEALRLVIFLLRWFPTSRRPRGNVTSDIPPVRLESRWFMTPSLCAGRLPSKPRAGNQEVVLLRRSRHPSPIEPSSSGRTDLLRPILGT